MTRQRTTPRQPPSAFGKARRAPRPGERKNVVPAPQGEKAPRGGGKPPRDQRRPR